MRMTPAGHEWTRDARKVINACEELEGLEKIIGYLDC